MAALARRKPQRCASAPLRARGDTRVSAAAAAAAVVVVNVDVVGTQEKELRKVRSRKMSSSQRMRKSSPCSKQGPMRATLPVSSLMRQGRQSSSLRKSNSNSPTVSPTNAAVWRARISPETSSSSGQRSPGSLSYKGTSPRRGSASLCVSVFMYFFRVALVILRASKSSSETEPVDDDFEARFRVDRYCMFFFLCGNETRCPFDIFCPAGRYVKIVKCSVRNVLVFVAKYKIGFPRTERRASYITIYSR